MPTDLPIAHLREAIEAAIGHPLRTPKDFDLLAETIFDKLHEHISPTTLKRLWGYLNDSASAPRRSTLNLLARFLDYPDWASFCASEGGDEGEKLPPPEPLPSDVPAVTTAATAGTRSADGAPSLTATDTAASGSADGGTSAVVAGYPSPTSPSPAVAPKKSHPSLFTRHFPFITLRFSLLILLLLLVITIPFAIRGLRAPEPNILRQGRTFATYDDYMQLFGLHSDETHTHFVRMPKQPYLCLWAPQYHHPVWHNDGNPDSLMPTISEYFTPADSTDSADVAASIAKNRDYYHQILRENEVRLVFMKNLFDSTFVYLGVYHISFDLSDSTRVVWYRVDNDIDLNHLDLLERHRF